MGWQVKSIQEQLGLARLQRIAMQYAQCSSSAAVQVVPHGTKDIMQDARDGGTSEECKKQKIKIYSLCCQPSTLHFFFFFLVPFFVLFFFIWTWRGKKGSVFLEGLGSSDKYWIGLPPVPHGCHTLMLFFLKTKAGTSSTKMIQIFFYFLTYKPQLSYFGPP